MALDPEPARHDGSASYDAPEPITCLSTEDHNHIRDWVSHYFGCIQIHQRINFFDAKNPFWKSLEEDPEFSGDGAKNRVDELREKSKKTVEDHNNRTRLLIKEISSKPPVKGAKGNLVGFVAESRDAWRKSTMYAGVDGIRRVEAWRNMPKVEDTTLSEGAPGSDPELYKLEEDVHAYIIQYEPQVPDTTGDPGSSKEDAVDDNPSRSDAGSRPSQGGTLLRLVGHTDKDERLKGTFPDQRLPIARLLDWKDSMNLLRLSHTGNSSGIRYFHFPSNNMKWAEEAIARYFDEERPRYNSIGSPIRETRSSMILRPEYWRGQQSGSYENRHMRPMCERISSHPPSHQKQRKDLVLFMPYLHWETSRAREQLSKALVIQAETQRQKLEKSAQTEKSDRKENLKKSKFPSRLGTISHGKIKENDRQGPVRTLTEVMELIRSPKTSEDLVTYQHGRLVVRSSPLGQYLLDAARLYEEMHLFRDKKICEYFMTGKATLHPRRTLDQYYYSTLKTTKSRDRDQVVYRGTTRDVERAHRFQEPDRANGVFHRLKISCDKTFSHHTEDLRRWTGHTAKEDEHGCNHCKADVQKVSKVIMVDQLWMWILDQKTIITCFPKRYGFHKHDSSGVHKCIRDRLKAVAPDEIQSVFNLGLIILDECSYTFFDRTRTEHQQPQTMDIFADAIGRINNKSTTGLDHLWHWTEKAGKIYRSKVKHVEALDLRVPLLDINPEGKLQREIKDVIDELDMMIHVVKKQKEVIKRYTKNVEHVLDPTPAGQLQVEIKSTDQSHGNSASNSNDSSTPGDRKQMLLSFQSQSQDLLEELEDRMEELEDLKRAAESTAQSVKDLLELKQQQAGVVQAWQAVNQADEAVSQGRAIMMFTIVTIVFLPMSFVSSVFGMNNSDFGDEWTFREQAVQYMVPISIGIIFITLLLGFSDFCRAILWWLWAHFGTFILVRTPLYGIWLNFRDGWSSQALYKSTEERVGKMKEEVRRAKAYRRAERTKAAEERKGEAQGQHVEDASSPSVNAAQSAESQHHNSHRRPDVNSPKRPRHNTREKPKWWVFFHPSKRGEERTNSQV